MGLYIAKKGNERFYIQPRMVGAYAEQGYGILKMQEVPVTDIEDEIKKISKEQEAQNNGGN